MKVGIITIHYVANYGALLQAYATKKIFERKCEDVSIIDYRTIEKERFYNIATLYKFEKRKGILSVLSIPRKIYINRYFIKARVKLEVFLKEMTKKEDIASKENIKNVCEKYDAIIVGSDQVWNPQMISLDKSFLLDFYNKKKYSFASSFGVADITDNNEELYKKYLEKFDLLSVREKEGKDLIDRMNLNKEAKVVLDPTLMLEKEEWNKFFDINGRADNEAYIMVYIVKEDKKIIRYAEIMQKKTGLPIVFVSTPGVMTVQKELRKYNCKCDITPKEWLSIVNNATYVLTNSFHGIAFSINYEKQFFVSYQTNDKYSRDLSRINNIINIFDLKDRVIYNDEIDITKEINYRKVRVILDKERKETQKYIDEIIYDIEG